MYINWFLNYIMKFYWDNVNCIKIRDLFLMVVCMLQFNGVIVMIYNDFDFFFYIFLEYC